jgi:hypothetical protein
LKEREYKELVGDDPVMGRLYRNFSLCQTNNKFYKITSPNKGVMHQKQASVFIVEQSYPCMTLGQSCKEVVRVLTKN